MYHEFYVGYVRYLPKVRYLEMKWLISLFTYTCVFLYYYLISNGIEYALLYTLSIVFGSFYIRFSNAVILAPPSSTINYPIRTSLA